MGDGEYFVEVAAAVALPVVYVGCHRKVARQVLRSVRGGVVLVFLVTVLVRR